MRIFSKFCDFCNIRTRNYVVLGSGEIQCHSCTESIIEKKTRSDSSSSNGLNMIFDRESSINSTNIPAPAYSETLSDVNESRVSLVNAVDNDVTSSERKRRGDRHAKNDLTMSDRYLCRVMKCEEFEIGFEDEIVFSYVYSSIVDSISISLAYYQASIKLIAAAQDLSYNNEDAKLDLLIELFDMIRDFPKNESLLLSFDSAIAENFQMIIKSKILPALSLYELRKEDENKLFWDYVKNALLNRPTIYNCILLTNTDQNLILLPFNRVLPTHSDYPMYLLASGVCNMLYSVASIARSLILGHYSDKVLLASENDFSTLFFSMTGTGRIDNATAFSKLYDMYKKFYADFFPDVLSKTDFYTVCEFYQKHVNAISSRYKEELDESLLEPIERYVNALRKNTFILRENYFIIGKTSIMQKEFLNSFNAFIEGIVPSAAMMRLYSVDPNRFIKDYCNYIISQINASIGKANILYFHSKIKDFVEMIDNVFTQSQLNTERERYLRFDYSFEDAKQNSMLSIDAVSDGLEFEHFLCNLFQLDGYMVQLTKSTGDQGADLIIEKGGITSAIQAKFYNSAIGNKAVQEVIAAQRYYGTHYGIVITNNTFTSAAIELAKSSQTRLIDGKELENMCDRLRKTIWQNNDDNISSPKQMRSVSFVDIFDSAINLEIIDESAFQRALEILVDRNKEKVLTFVDIVDAAKELDDNDMNALELSLYTMKIMILMPGFENKYSMETELPYIIAGELITQNANRRMTNSSILSYVNENLSDEWHKEMCLAILEDNGINLKA